MKQKTNGKIVIAILAMFAVAASVIGFTYAYFTANLTRNNQNESVEIYAGKLMATFRGTNSIDANNVVPGWTTNDLWYYNANATSVQDGTIEAIQISNAESATNEDKAAWGALETDPFDVTSASVLEYRNMGLTAPVAFTVNNTSTNADPDDYVYYLIRLNITKNEVRAANASCSTNVKKAEGESDEEYNARLTACQNDYQNLTVALYKGEFEFDETATSANYYDNTATTEDAANSVLAGKFYLGESNTYQTIVTDAEGLLKGGSQNYFIMFEYANDSSYEQYTKGAEINLSVEIVGLNYVNLGTEAAPDWKYVDENNQPITFPTADVNIVPAG